MVNQIFLRNLQRVANELYMSKCEEVKRLSNRENGPPKWIDIRKTEASSLKELVEGIKMIVNHYPDNYRQQIYLQLDKSLQRHFQKDPNLKGAIIFMGPDKPELTSYFTRIAFNIPITFFRA